MMQQLMTGTGDKHGYSGRHSRPSRKIPFGSEHLRRHRAISVWIRKLGEVPSSAGRAGQTVHSSLPFTSEPGEPSDVRPARNVYADTLAVFYHSFMLQMSLSYTVSIGVELGHSTGGRRGWKNNGNKPGDLQSQNLGQILDT